jgi:hypothetical protein
MLCTRVANNIRCVPAAKKADGDRNRLHTPKLMQHCGQRVGGSLRQYRSTRRRCRPGDQIPACPCRARVCHHVRAVGPKQAIQQAIAVGCNRRGCQREVGRGKLQAGGIAQHAKAITPGCDRICGLSPGTACLQTNQTLSCRVGPSLQSRPSFADRHPERQPRGKVWRQCGETNAPCCRGLSAHTLPLSGPGLRRAPGSARQKQKIH